MGRFRLSQMQSNPREATISLGRLLAAQLTNDVDHVPRLPVRLRLPLRLAVVPEQKCRPFGPRSFASSVSLLSKSPTCSVRYVARDCDTDFSKKQQRGVHTTIALCLVTECPAWSPEQFPGMGFC